MKWSSGALKNPLHTVAWPESDISPTGGASGIGSEFLVRTCSQQLDSVCSLHLPEGFRVDLAVHLAAAARSTPSAAAPDAGQGAQDEHSGSHPAPDRYEDAHQVVVLPPCYPGCEEVSVRSWFLHNFPTSSLGVVEHGISFVRRSVWHRGGNSLVCISRHHSRRVVRCRHCSFVGRGGVVVGTRPRRRSRGDDHEGRALCGGTVLAVIRGPLGDERRCFTRADDNRRYYRPQQETAAPVNEHGGGSSCGLRCWRRLALAADVGR